jgi:phosphomevalonate kinase
MVRNTAASAPGKVLLAGGYLVVDRAYTGLVLGLSARIHVHVQDSRSGNEIVVRSPQFQEATWTYEYHPQVENGGTKVVQTKR